MDTTSLPLGGHLSLLDGVAQSLARIADSQFDPLEPSVDEGEEEVVPEGLVLEVVERAEVLVGSRRLLGEGASFVPARESLVGDVDGADVVRVVAVGVVASGRDGPGGAWDLPGSSRVIPSAGGAGERTSGSGAVGAVAGAAAGRLTMDSYCRIGPSGLVRGARVAVESCVRRDPAGLRGTFGRAMGHCALLASAVGDGSASCWPAGRRWCR